MAQRLTYGSEEQKSGCRMATLIYGEETYSCECYEDCYFDFDTFPDDMRQYYCRHSDDDWCEPVSVREKLGFMVNFWGCIVTDREIDFHGQDEIDVEFLFDYND